jgi:hypothetical protein
MGSEIFSVEFPTPGMDMANEKITEWTHGQATYILSEESIPPESKAVLTATVYIDSKWTNPFTSLITKPFTKPSGTDVDVRFMVQSFSDVLYYEDDHHQVLALPYAESTFSTVFVLNRDIHQNAQLEDDEFVRLTSQLKPSAVYAEIPRFAADFGPRSMRSFLPPGYHGQVSDIIVRCTFGNYDEGTIATLNRYEDDCVPLEPAFVANHSFLFYCVDLGTGVILAMGSVTCPIALDLTIPTSDSLPTFLTEGKREWTDFDKALGLEPEKEEGEEEEKVPEEEAEIPVPEDSDLVEFINEDGGRAHGTKEEIDALFGVVTKNLVTYPQFSPWADVVIKPPPTAEMLYETAKRPRHPLLPGIGQKGGPFSAGGRPVRRVIQPKVATANRPNLMRVNW